jgi:hypothetical protein
MSKIEVDAIDKQSGSTLTLGGSGTAVTLGAGATQTGFGRTGTVNWQTGSIKTATFTAANGEGYFCNTAGGTFEVDLPAGSAGAIVSVQDYNNTFDSHSLTVDPDGTEKINGGDGGEAVELSTEGLGVTFVYVDATVGWRSIQSNEYATAGSADAFICASVNGSGNAITTAPCCANVKIATFTGPGDFIINSGAGTLSKVDYMVVAGGGGGGGSQPGFWAGGGGGAGGFRESKSVPISGSWTASPLSSTTPLGPFVPGTYAVAIGGGGPSGTGNPNYASRTPGGNGVASSFSTITSAGGGGGSRAGGPGNAVPNANNGGSGGGGGGYSANATSGGVGNTPVVTPPQGQPGGNGRTTTAAGGAGGGGAGGAGGNAAPNYGDGAGGAGVANSITGSSVTRSAGACAGGPSGSASSGGANTGNAGDGGFCGAPQQNGGTGGSGIVIIRYKFQ